MARKSPQQQPLAKERAAAGASARVRAGERHQRRGTCLRAARTVPPTLPATRAMTTADGNWNGSPVIKMSEATAPGMSIRAIKRSCACTTKAAAAVAKAHAAAAKAMPE